MKMQSIIWTLLLFISIVACTSKSDKNPSLIKESIVSGKVISHYLS